MSNFKKKILSGVIAVMLSMGGLFVWGINEVDEVHAEVVGSGTLSPGNGVSWQLTDDGALTITKTGTWTDMTDFGSYNYEYHNCAPWLKTTTKIKTVVVDEGVTSIGNYAFDSCKELTSVSLPSTVTKIGQGAFSNCSALTSIDIPHNIESIGNSAFMGCSSLTDVFIPGNKGVYIPPYAFRNCTSLTNVTISSGVYEIYYDAFEGCSSLTSIDIPDSVREIDTVAFDRGITICANPGSYAETYAINKGYTFNCLSCEFKTDYTVDQEPTCTAPGSKSIHCNNPNCSMIKPGSTIEIPSPGHSYAGEKLNYNKTGHWKVCDNCEFEDSGNIIPHADGDPTESFDCTECNYRFSTKLTATVTPTKCTVTEGKIHTEPMAFFKADGIPSDGSMIYGCNYQWYSCNLDGTGRTAIPEANNSKFRVPEELTDGTYYFICEVTGLDDNYKIVETVDTAVVKVEVADGAAVVIFDAAANGGRFSDGDELKNSDIIDEKVSDPGIPAKEGCRFSGWYTDPYGMEPVDLSTKTFTHTTRLYAQYDVKTTVSLDANGGQFSDDTAKYYIEFFGIYVSKDLFPEPKRDGYVFDGWYRQTDDGEEGPLTPDPETGEYELYEINFDFYAKWSKVEVQEELSQESPIKADTSQEKLEKDEPLDKSAETGDDSNMILILLLLLVSCVGMVAALFARKKHQTE